MATIKQLFKVCLLIFASIELGIVQGHAQKLDSMDQAYWIECHTKVQALAPNHGGNTSSGNTYKLVAVKYRKDWLFIVSDSISFDSYFMLSKTDSLIQNSLFFDNNLCRLIEEYIEPESNPKESIFGELVLTDYYTIKREGKKFYEQIVEAETGKNFPGFFAKLGKVVAWPADKLLGLEKIADMKKAVEAQKKAIEDKVKEIQDIKAQTETLTVALEETKKENEKLKAELEESKKEPEWEVYPSVLDVIEQDTAQAKPTISPTDSLSMDVKSDSLVVASTDSLGNITPPKNITPEDSLNLQNINTITADTLSSVSNISKIDSIKSNKNTVPVYLTKEDSLQASRIELQNEIKNSSGQASETGLKLPEDIEQLKARKEALKKERESLEIKLVQSYDAQESKQINEELIALDEELKQILEKMKIRLQEEKAILEKESNRLR